MCVVSLEVEEKPPPVMRHQWMRGSIDDSQVGVAKRSSKEERGGGLN